MKYKDFIKTAAGKKIADEMCIETETDFIGWQYEMSAMIREGALDRLDVQELTNKFGISVEDLDEYLAYD